MKRGARTAIEYDRDIRQAVQNKAIDLAKGGKYGTNGKLLAPAAEKIKELWDKYDEFKLSLLK